MNEGRNKNGKMFRGRLEERPTTAKIIFAYIGWAIMAVMVYVLVVLTLCL